MAVKVDIDSEPSIIAKPKVVDKTEPKSKVVDELEQKPEVIDKPELESEVITKLVSLQEEISSESPHKLKSFLLILL